MGDETGAALETTRRYSADVGAVFKVVRGASVSFTLTGKELYVRATITSDRPAENPSFDGQLKQAWTQPVGWERFVSKGREN